jgi:glycosyl transferase family 1
MNASAPIRVLTNIRLPGSEGYIFHTFGDYLPPGSSTTGRSGAGSAPAWSPENERRALADILPLIPPAEKPDILIISTPEYLPIPVDVASFPGIRILLITDWNVCLRFLPDLCPLFDFCFTDWPGFRMLSRAGLPNVRHQPLFGHDPAVFADQGRERNLEVSFCGNLNAGLHRERNRLLARLAKWGAAGGRALSLGQAFQNDYVDVLNRSRLVFNYSIRGEANMRLFEAMACGAVPLVEASNREAAILFREGVHFFRYEPDGLEAKLESLLADPARIQAASVAARAAVAGHTKAAQIRSLLDAAVREHGAGGRTAEGAKGSTAGSGRSGATAALAGPARSVKALVKLRVLGAAYTLPEALGELQGRSAALPGLDVETLPGMLLSLLEANPDGSLAAARNILERLLDAGGRPDGLRDFFRMRLAALDRNWEAVMEASKRCREASSTEGIHRHFLTPVELGKGLNTDLNRAYRADLEREPGSHPGYAHAQGFLGLLRAHCLAQEARALLALGRPGEGLRIAEGIPRTDFVSVDPFELMAGACAALGDGTRLRTVLLAWYAERPLDTAVWSQVAEGLDRLGDKAGLIAFLEEILALSRHFLPPAHGEMVRGMLDKRRG